MLSKFYKSFLVLICTAKSLRELGHEICCLSNVTVLTFDHKKAFIICYNRHFTLLSEIVRASIFVLTWSRRKGRLKVH